MEILYGYSRRAALGGWGFKGQCNFLSKLVEFIVSEWLEVGVYSSKLGDKSTQISRQVKRGDKSTWPKIKAARPVLLFSR